jgi:hypothetical protein
MIYKYLESLRNKPNKPDPRFLRGAGFDEEEESESADRETDKVELECRSLTLESGASIARSWCSTVANACASFGGVLGAGDRSLVWI